MIFDIDMKLLARQIIGLTSSLLLSAGLSHAAQRLDPLSQQVGNSSQISSLSQAPADACTWSCERANRVAPADACTWPCERGTN